MHLTYTVNIADNYGNAMYSKVEIMHGACARPFYYSDDGGRRKCVL